MGKRGIPKVRIFINNVPIEKFTEEELQKIREVFTDRMIRASGGIPLDDDGSPVLEPLTYTIENLEERIGS